MSRDSSPLIYIVDDEPLLVALAEISLISEGYRFRKFEDPTLALEAMAQETEPPALLLTDFMMAGLNGLQLAERARELFPELPIIILSGTAGPEILAGATTRVEHFINKPYRTQDLLEIVREVLRA